MSNTIIEVKNLSKSFTVGVQAVPVLKNVSLEVNQGDFLIIFGPSGCGKSTLLHTILGLEQPTSGTVVFLGKDVYSDGLATEDDRSQFRKEHIGMVYQQPNWIKALTVVENVAFPLALLGEDKGVSIQKAANILQSIGMANWASYQTSELSSGQQQRIALARALITNPEVIIADEPTGNLDFESGQELMELLVRLNKGDSYSPDSSVIPAKAGIQKTESAWIPGQARDDKKGKTVVMVTHDLEYLKYARSAAKMFNGEVIEVYSEKDKDKLLREIRGKRGNGNEKS